MDSFVKNLPLIYCPLPLPPLVLEEVELVGKGWAGEVSGGGGGATVGKVKISIRLSVTAVSHPRKTDTQADTDAAAGSVLQHGTYSTEAGLPFFPCWAFFFFFFQPITVKKKKAQKMFKISLALVV